MDRCLTIDIGSSGCRAALYDDPGKMIFFEERLYKLKFDGDKAEQNATEIYGNVLYLICSAAKKSDSLINTIIFGSVLHSLVLVDEAGQPLTPLTTWGDLRASKAVKNLYEIHRQHGWQQKTGCPASPVYPLYRLVWYKENEPEIFNSFSKAISIKSFVLFQLTGLFVEDYSIASGSGFFNIHELCWENEILNLIELDQRRLPRTVPVEHKIENRDDKTSTIIQTIIIGSGDGPLAHLGSAGTAGNICSLTLGTSGAVRIARETPPVEKQNNLWCYILKNDIYIEGIATNNGGNVLDWFVQKYGPTKIKKGDIETILNRVQFDPGLFFFPFIYKERNSIFNHKIENGFMGLTKKHTFQHQLCAVIEGIVFNLLYILEYLREVTQKPERIVLSGGLASPEFVRHLFADLIDLPVEFSPIPNASLMGAFELYRGIRDGRSDNLTANTNSIVERGIVAAESRENREKYKNWKEFIIKDSTLSSYSLQSNLS